MIGDFPLSVDENRDVTVLGFTYEGTEGLLIRVNLNRSLVTPNDMPSYKRILESTNRRLSDNDPSGHTQIIGVPKYSDIKIVPYREHVEESTAATVDGFQTINKLYYDPLQASSFSLRGKLEAAALKTGYPAGKSGDWLLRHTRTFCTGLRGRSFPGIPTL
jgi:hypothetical protein